MREACRKRGQRKLLEKKREERRARVEAGVAAESPRTDARVSGPAVSKMSSSTSRHWIWPSTISKSCSQDEFVQPGGGESLESV